MEDDSFSKELEYENSVVLLNDQNLIPKNLTPHLHLLHPLYKEIRNHYKKRNFGELEQCFCQFSDIISYGRFSIDDVFNELNILSIIIHCVFESTDTEKDIITASLKLLVSLTCLSTDYFTSFICNDEEILTRICTLSTTNSISIVCLSNHILANIISQNQDLHDRVIGFLPFDDIWTQMSDKECPETVKTSLSALIHSITIYGVDESIRELLTESIVDSIKECIDSEDVIVELFHSLNNMDLRYEDTIEIAISKDFFSIDINKIPNDENCLSFYLKFCGLAIRNSSTFKPNIRSVIRFLNREKYQEKVVINALYVLLVSCNCFNDDTEEDPKEIMLSEGVLSVVWSLIKKSENAQYLSVSYKLLCNLLSICDTHIIESFITETFVTNVVDVLCDTDEESLEINLCSLLIQFIITERKSMDTDNVAQLCISSDLIDSIREKHDNPEDELVIAVDKLESLLGNTDNA